MSGKIAIIGASSPFILGLINSLAASPLTSIDLTLHGSNQQCLTLVTVYTKNLLRGKGWRIAASNSLAKALESADIIVHQPRYGGLRGRIADEDLAERANAVADETLGPGGLQAALRMAPALREFAKCTRRVAPRAWVLNLTNPLSLSCSILAEAGTERVVGVCELPQETAHKFLQLCGRKPEHWSWHVIGLNHRSFIHSLSMNGRLHSLGELCSECSSECREIGAVPLHEIARWNALPTKYFKFFCGSLDNSYGRARFVESVKRAAFAQLESRTDRFPQALLNRPMPWYPFAVVPLLHALSQNSYSVLVVNNVGTDGITREVRARVSGSKITPVRSPSAPEFAQEWTQKYVEHELMMLNACRSGSRADITRALLSDPLMPAETARDTAATIYENVRNIREIT